MFLIAGKIVEMENLAKMGGQLGMYTISVIVGLLIHGMFVLPLLYFVVTRKNPFLFIGGLLQALVTALGTSSRWVLFIAVNTDLCQNDPFCPFIEWMLSCSVWQMLNPYLSCLLLVSFFSRQSNYTFNTLFCVIIIISLLQFCYSAHHISLLRGKQPCGQKSDSLRPPCRSHN